MRVRLAALIDKNGDGVIDYQEFLPVCFSMIVEILSDKVCVEVVNWLYQMPCVTGWLLDIRTIGTFSTGFALPPQG